MDHVARIYKGELSYQYQDRLDRDISRHKEGDWVSVKITKPRKEKTPQQMGYYFAVILPTAHSAMLELGWDIKGVPINEPMVDHILKACCGDQPSKATMSVEDASVFIDNCIMYANSELGCTIPPPTKKES